jgi:hypothetical protein
MELQPFGPVEQALIQSSNSPSQATNNNGKFWLGMITGLAISGVVWLATAHLFRKREERIISKDDPS